MSNLKKHLNPATVISCVALFVALSGAAYAVSPIGKQAVKTQNLANGAVTALKLRGGSVTTAKLRNLSVTGPKLGEASVTSGKLASGSVRSSALGGQVVTEGKIKNGGVTNEKLANGAVTSSKLAANAVETGKLENGSITAAKLNAGFLAQLVKDVTYVPGTSPSNTTEATKTATATCPAGKQVIGGGVKLVGGNEPILVLEEGPSTANSQGKRTGWTAVAKETAANATDWSVEVTAICAEF